MNIFKKKRIRSLLAIVILASFLGQTVLAGGGIKPGTSNQGGTSVTKIDIKNPGVGQLTGHFGWLLSLQEVPNVASKYGSTEYSDCSISVADKYLYTYPEEYLYDYVSNVQNYAYIDYSTTEASYTNLSGALKTFNGKKKSSQKLSNVYGASQHSADSGNFNNNAKLIENNANYNTLKKLLEQRQLTIETLRASGIETNINAAVNSFVGLWNNAGDVDDKITTFTHGLSGESLEYFDKMLRYLDVFLIVNYMCGNVYDNYINNFCKSLNNDYSANFLTILIASGVVMHSDSGRVVVTLPVHYAFRSDISVEDLRHPSGMAGNDDIFSAATTNINYSDIQNFYKTAAPNKQSSTISDAMLDKWWWKEGKKAALTLYPNSVLNANSGNVGYTYISTDVETIPPPPPPTPENPVPTPVPTPPPAPSVPELEFYISVESDNYMLNQQTAPASSTVSATVTVDCRQKEEELRKLKLIYDSLPDNYNTAIEIVVQRSFNDASKIADVSGNIADINKSDSKFATNYKNSPPNMAIFRWEGAAWEEAYKLFMGQYKVQFVDSGLKVAAVDGKNVNEAKATYHAVVRFSYYPKTYTYVQAIETPTFSTIANGTGKLKCEASCTADGQVTPFAYAMPLTKWAHDIAEWIFIGPEAVNWYSSFEPGNYAELKHNDVRAETYEAMAGIPTDEGLYLAAGFTEFAVNFEGEIRTNSGETREYTYIYTTTNCIAEDNVYCNKSCSGHLSNPCQNQVDGVTQIKNGKPVTPRVTCGARTTIYCDGSSASGSCGRCGAGLSVSVSGESASGCGERITGSGCKITHYVNSAHPHNHTYTFKIKQPIADYQYLNILNADVWQVEKTDFIYNDEILNTSKNGTKPKTEVNYYNAGTGDKEHLIFSKGNSGSSSSAEKTKASEGYAEAKRLVNEFLLNEVNGVQMAVISDYIELKNSDDTYQVLTGNVYTSQAVNCSYQYSDSYSEDKVDKDEGVDTERETELPNEQGLIFNANAGMSLCSPWQAYPEEAREVVEARANKDLWQRYDDVGANIGGGNAYSNAIVQPETLKTYSYQNFAGNSLYRVGYTGNYVRSGAYASAHYYTNGESFADTALFGGSKKVSDITGTKSSVKGSQSGTDAWKICNIDINDLFKDKQKGGTSEDNVYRPDESTDANAPVSNGLHDTGNVYLKMPWVAAIKDDSYKDADGDKSTQYGTFWSTADENRLASVNGSDGAALDNGNANYAVELGYTEGKRKVNDIVVFNPVSVFNARVQSIDSKYDLRVNCNVPSASNPSYNLEGCPGDASCTYSVLPEYSDHAKESGRVFSMHDPVDCYATTYDDDVNRHYQADGSYGPAGMLNVHKHNASCATIGELWELNAHVCDARCLGGSNARVLNCHDPHHYTVMELQGKWIGFLKPTDPTVAELESMLKSGNNVTIAKAENVIDVAVQAYFNAGSEEAKAWYSDGTHHGSECWEPCMDDSKHLPGVAASFAEFDATGSLEERRNNIAFVGLDREFKLQYPTTGDFLGNNALGILETTGTLGAGWSNGMSTERWLRDKYVTFTFDVLVKNPNYDGTIDANGLGAYVAFTAGTPIPWYDYFKESNEGTFYIPMENSEQVNGTARFNAIAVNGAKSGITQENANSTNLASDTYTYKRKHDAYLMQFVDVIGSIGALSIVDTGDPRFASLFKQEKETDKWLIDGLVKEVYTDKPNYKTGDDGAGNTVVKRNIISDRKTVKNVKAKGISWQNVWETLTPGKLSDGSYKVGSYLPEPSSVLSSYGGKWKASLKLPLTPKYLDAVAEGLSNQALRIGYGVYMDVQTLGNYYGVNTGDKIKSQVVVKPNYTLVVPTGNIVDGKSEYKSYAVDAYALNSRGDYSLVNYYASISNTVHNDDLKAVNIYLDWMTEEGRRNATMYELETTKIGNKTFFEVIDGDGGSESVTLDDGKVVSKKYTGVSAPQSEAHKIGTTHLLRLTDRDKTFVGSMYTTDGLAEVLNDSQFMNGRIADEQGKPIDNSYLIPADYTKQGQRYHFTVSLPSSTCFVLAGKNYSDRTHKEYEELAKTEGAHILLSLSIIASGEVWNLGYEGEPVEYTYQGMKFSYGKPDDGSAAVIVSLPDGSPSVSTVEPGIPVSVFDPLKTSKDDLDTVGTH